MGEEGSEASGIVGGESSLSSGSVNRPPPEQEEPTPLHHHHQLQPQEEEEGISSTSWKSYISEDLPRTVVQSTDSAIRSARSLQHTSQTHFRTLRVCTLSLFPFSLLFSLLFTMKWINIRRKELLSLRSAQTLGRSSSHRMDQSMTRKEEDIVLQCLILVCYPFLWAIYGRRICTTTIKWITNETLSNPWIDSKIYAYPCFIWENQPRQEGAHSRTQRHRPQEMCVGWRKLKSTRDRVMWQIPTWVGKED